MSRAWLLCSSLSRIAVASTSSPARISEDRKIQIRYIQPGKPDQNAFVERFNRSFRQEVLDAYLFGSVAEVQELSDDWLGDYNENRPHDSLGGIPPTQFLPRPTAPGLSTFQVCA